MYIDPAAGSMIVQVLAAAVLGALAAFRNVRTAIKDFVRNALGRRPAE